MKKSALYGLIASLSVVSVADAADSTPLVTQNYVDSGLRAVYKAATDKVTELREEINGDGTTAGLSGDVAQLKETVGDENSGLVKKVNELSVGNRVYTAGDGVNISVNSETGTGVVSVSGAAATTEAGNTDKMYVFKNGTLTPMETVTSTDWGN